MVPLLVGVSYTLRLVQVRPSSVDFARWIGWTQFSVVSVDWSSTRSHTAYTTPGWYGSAVIDGRSLKNSGLSSRASVTGAAQCSPPSPDRDTRMAVVPPVRDSENDAAMAAPDGVIVTQWSVVTS